MPGLAWGRRRDDKLRAWNPPPLLLAPLLAAAACSSCFLLHVASVLFSGLFLRIRRGPGERRKLRGLREGRRNRRCLPLAGMNVGEGRVAA